MAGEIVFDEARREEFWDFVAERQAIWHRRHVEGSEAPWTDDPILAENRFTNVYRRLDPGTRYAEERILALKAGKQDKLFNLLIYRVIGRKETHERLGFQHLAQYHPDHLVKTLHAIRDEGEAPFTGAYMVSGYAQFGSDDKAENVARMFDGIRLRFPVLWSRVSTAREAKDAFTALAGLEGIGPFLAYQVLVDAMYDVSGEQLLEFSDTDWAQAGPGAKVGIRILVPEAGNEDELAVMKTLQGNQVKRLVPRKFKWWMRNGKPEPLRLSDIQNCLCEYHKYVKIAEGTGRARRKYRSE